METGFFRAERNSKPRSHCQLSVMDLVGRVGLAGAAAGPTRARAGRDCVCDNQCRTLCQVGMCVRCKLHIAYRFKTTSRHLNGMLGVLGNFAS